MLLISCFILYTVLSQPFTGLQRLIDPTLSTLSVDISKNGSALVTGNYDDKTYIFKSQNDTFYLSQTISSSEDVMVTDITSDG